MSEYQARPEAKHRIVLSGERVDLVALAARHLPLVIAWRNNPALRQRFFNRRVFTMASEVEWFARYAVDPTAFCFTITLKGGRTIGMLGIKIDWRERTGEFGRFLIGDPLSLGRGYGREAARVVLEFAKSELRLRSVWLAVTQDNVVALNLYRSLGFVEASRFPRETSDGARELAVKMILAFDLSPAVGSPESDSVPS